MASPHSAAADAAWAKDPDWIVPILWRSEFRSALAELSSDKREAAFWAEDAFLSGLRQVKDAWNRLFDLSERGGIQLNSEKDRAWIRRRLSDPAEAIDRREMMLWAEMTLLHRDEPDYRRFLESLKPFVADSAKLTEIIDNRMKPQEGAADIRRIWGAPARTGAGFSACAVGHQSRPRHDVAIHEIEVRRHRTATPHHSGRRRVSRNLRR